MAHTATGSENITHRAAAAMETVSELRASSSATAADPLREARSVQPAIVPSGSSTVSRVTDETPGFVDLQDAFADEVQFLGLSTDADVADVRRFAEQMDVNYPLLVGPNRAGDGYRVPALPTTFLIDRDGRVRFRHEGLLLAHALRPALRALVRE